VKARQEITPNSSTSQLALLEGDAVAFAAHLFGHEMLSDKPSQELENGSKRKTALGMAMVGVFELMPGSTPTAFASDIPFSESVIVNKASPSVETPIWPAFDTNIEAYTRPVQIVVKAEIEAPPISQPALPVVEKDFLLSSHVTPIAKPERSAPMHPNVFSASIKDFTRPVVEDTSYITQPVFIPPKRSVQPTGVREPQPKAILGNKEKTPTYHEPTGSITPLEITEATLPSLTDNGREGNNESPAILTLTTPVTVPVVGVQPIEALAFPSFTESVEEFTSLVTDSKVLTREFLVPPNITGGSVEDFTKPANGKVLYPSRTKHKSPEQISDQRVKKHKSPEQISEQRAAVVRAFRSQRGVAESGGEDNGTPRWRYADGRREPWCADYVSFAFEKAGMPFEGGKGVVENRIPWTVNMIRWLEKDPHSQVYTIDEVRDGKYRPQPGDLAFYKKRRNNNRVNHVEGIVDVNGRTLEVSGGNVSDRVTEHPVRLSDPTLVYIATRFANTKKVSPPKSSSPSPDPIPIPIILPPIFTSPDDGDYIPSEGEIIVPETLPETTPPVITETPPGDFTQPTEDSEVIPETPVPVLPAFDPGADVEAFTEPSRDETLPQDKEDPPKSEDHEKKEEKQPKPKKDKEREPRRQRESSWDRIYDPNSQVLRTLEAQLPKIRALQSVYEQAGQATGVDPDALAAIHYAEGGNARDKSAWAGERLGTRNPDTGRVMGTTIEENVELAAEHLKRMAKGVYGIKLTEDSSDSDYAKALLSYNRGAMYKRQGLGPQDSPYVMTGIDNEHMPMRFPNGPAEPRSTRGREHSHLGSMTVFEYLNRLDWAG